MFAKHPTETGRNRTRLTIHYEGSRDLAPRDEYPLADDWAVASRVKLTHEAIGVEVRRGTFEVVVDGDRVGSVEMNDTIDKAGNHGTACFRR